MCTSSGQCRAVGTQGVLWGLERRGCQELRGDCRSCPWAELGVL